MKASPPYPFPVSPHTIWVLKQLLDTPRKWNLSDDEFFILKSFNEEHEPCIENDYYTYEILRHLENERSIKIIKGDGKGIRRYELPLPDKPTHSMVYEWEVQVLNKPLVHNLLNNIVYKAKIKIANKLDEWHCHFEIDDDSILWMKTELGRYPLKQLNYGLISYKVLVTLCESGVVELLDDGSIKSGKYSGTKVKSLQEILRGVGFNRMLKKSFFEESTLKRIALKSPAPAFRRSFHEAVIEIFEESSRMRNTLNNSKRKIADFPRYNHPTKRD